MKSHHLLHFPPNMRPHNVSGYALLFVGFLISFLIAFFIALKASRAEVLTPQAPQVQATPACPVNVVLRGVSQA